ncbi:MAG: hypothetical protein RR101_03290 [Burkholderiaceae bacterium]
MKRFSHLGAVLSVGYFVFGVFVIFQRMEGSWGGFFLFWTAFPGSLVSFFTGHLVPIGWGDVDILVIGTIWWYLVGYYFQYRRRL